MAKTHQLVAWTCKGKVRMVPEVMEPVLQPVRSRIIRLEKEYVETADEKTLLKLIAACEQLGDALSRFGSNVEAFRQYAEGARLCLNCPDIFWADSDDGWLLLMPFRGRFLTLYGKCRNLVAKHPGLSALMRTSGLERDYQSVIPASCR